MIVHERYALSRQIDLILDCLALKWRGDGGLVILAGIAGLLLMRSDLTSIDYFLPGVAAPGDSVFYLLGLNPGWTR